MTAKKEVTPFDVREQRLEGTDAEHFKVFICCRNVCVYPFSREGGITLFGDHRGFILLNRAETSQEG